MINNYLNTSWGKNTKLYSKKYTPNKLNDIKSILFNNRNITIQGNRRSYGDVCLGDKILSTKNLSKIIYFNKKKGEIFVESGVLLKKILQIIIPCGWFLHSTPGTKYVSIGGMVANNIHGKNNKNNLFKNSIIEITLIDGAGKIITCSPKKNKKIFDITVGGFGLSGLILRVKFKLKKISSNYISQRIIEFKGFKKFFYLSKIINYEYVVFWISKLEYNSLEGLLFLGNHDQNKNIPKKILFKQSKLNKFQLSILSFILKSSFFFNLLNIFYKKYNKYFYKKKTTLDNFFYPQDRIENWNDAYESGFFQIHFLVKKNKIKKCTNRLIKFLDKEKLFSTFIIIKKFNEVGEYLNFSGDGYSVSMDFRIGDKFNLLRSFLNQLIRDYDLKVNFSKDLITGKNSIVNKKKYFSFKKDVKKFNNGRFSSIFAKRLGLT